MLSSYSKKTMISCLGNNQKQKRQDHWKIARKWMLLAHVDMLIPHKATGKK